MDIDVKNEVIDEVKYYKCSGFYSDMEVKDYIKEELEYMEEEYTENNVEEIMTELEKLVGQNNSGNFNRLDNAFKKLENKKIITMHKAGGDMDEGFEILNEIATKMHLENNTPIGCCFYYEQSLMNLIENKNQKLYLTYGNYLDNPDAVTIGEIIYSVLLEEGFEVEWNHDKNSKIAVVNLKWDKNYYL